MLRIEKIAGSLGAEILGFDLAADPIATETVTAIHQALLDHKVVFFREQTLDPDRYLAFADHFGAAVEYPFAAALDGYPRITQVAKMEDDEVNFGGIWHSDTTYMAEPPKATMLLAKEVPEYGGDTLFANTVQAYETLSDGMKRMLEGLKIVNDSQKLAARRNQSHGVGNAESGFAAEHPVIRTHPETGAKSLYLSYGHSLRFADMTEAESAPLLTYLFQHQVRPEFTCRFAWRAGSLAFWDNRSSLHYAINDYPGRRRIMHRITLSGDRPK